ncbi:MAG: hypothetical protein E6I60_11920 [Chloroflexi bacterium]|nr:MAG: hypothetical protein E6I60_11920 [Chloroflexota bacterium]
MGVDKANDLQDPSSRGQAALVASTLTRVAPIVDELERVWPTLRIPTSAIIDQYVQIAQELTPKHVDWEVENPPEPPESLRDLVDSCVETFALATPVVGSSDYRELLLAAEELVEALDHAASSGTANDHGVAIDSGIYELATTERNIALSQWERISREADERLARLLPELIEESHRIGLAYMETFRSIGPLNAAKARGPTLASGTRPAQLIDALKTFSKEDWDAVEPCARKLDRPSALAAGRQAMKAIGIDESHELLEGARATIPFPGETAWELVVRAILGAASWDRLDNEARQLVMECLVRQERIKRLVDAW